MTTNQLTDSQLNSMSLGELAYMIRLSVQKQTTQEQLLSQLKWKHEHAGQTQIPFSPEERMQCEPKNYLICCILLIIICLCISLFKL
jgi:hypothetical protein